MRALLEFLDEWGGGNNGDYYDYWLFLRSPVLAGERGLSKKKGGF